MLTNMACSSMLPGSSRRPPKRSVFFRFCSQALAIPAETGVRGAGARQKSSSGPSPKPPVGGAALPPEATETIQRAVIDPRLRARVQELDSNPHPIGGPHASVIHEPPETAGAGDSSPAAVPSPHARDPIVCFSISLVKQCPRPALWRGQVKSLGAHSTPFPGADAGVFVD